MECKVQDCQPILISILIDHAKWHCQGKSNYTSGNELMQIQSMTHSA